MFPRRRPALLCAALAGLAVVDAVKWDGPLPTRRGLDNGVLGWTPKPTPAPLVGGQYDHELFGLMPRQETLNSVCGWANGDAARSIVCNPGSVCATANGALACCASTDIGGCTIRTTCSETTNPGNGGVETLYCGQDNKPHCLTIEYTFPTVIATGYACAVTAGTLTVLSPLAESHSLTPASGGGGGGGGGGTDVGAIAGGVVGGVVGLVLIGVLLWFFLFRRKRQKAPKPAYDSHEPSMAESRGMDQHRSTYPPPLPAGYAYRSGTDYDYPGQQRYTSPPPQGMGQGYAPPQAPFMTNQRPSFQGSGRGSYQQSAHASEHDSFRDSGAPRTLAPAAMTLNNTAPAPDPPSNTPLTGTFTPSVAGARSERVGSPDETARTSYASGGMASPPMQGGAFNRDSSRALSSEPGGPGQHLSTGGLAAPTASPNQSSPYYGPSRSSMGGSQWASPQVNDPDPRSSRGPSGAMMAAGGAAVAAAAGVGAGVAGARYYDRSPQQPQDQRTSPQPYNASGASPPRGQQPPGGPPPPGGQLPPQQQSQMQPPPQQQPQMQRSPQQQPQMQPTPEQQSQQGPVGWRTYQPYMGPDQQQRSVSSPQQQQQRQPYPEQPRFSAPQAHEDPLIPPEPIDTEPRPTSVSAYDANLPLMDLGSSAGDGGFFSPRVASPPLPENNVGMNKGMAAAGAGVVAGAGAAGVGAAALSHSSARQEEGLSSDAARGIAADPIPTPRLSREYSNEQRDVNAYADPSPPAAPEQREPSPPQQQALPAQVYNPVGAPGQPSTIPSHATQIPQEPQELGEPERHGAETSYQAPQHTDEREAMYSAPTPKPDDRAGPQTQSHDAGVASPQVPATYTSSSFSQQQSHTTASTSRDVPSFSTSTPAATTTTPATPPQLPPLQTTSSPMPEFASLASQPPPPPSSLLPQQLQQPATTTTTSTTTTNLTDPRGQILDSSGTGLSALTTRASGTSSSREAASSSSYHDRPPDEAYEADSKMVTGPRRPLPATGNEVGSPAVERVGSPVFHIVSE